MAVTQLMLAEALDPLQGGDFGHGSTPSIVAALPTSRGSISRLRHGWQGVLSTEPVICQPRLRLSSMVQACSSMFPCVSTLITTVSSSTTSRPSAPTPSTTSSDGALALTNNPVRRRVA